MNPWVLLGSLAGVLGLAAFARLLGLGGGRIADAAEACRLAETHVSGFVALRGIVATDGQTALVLTTAGPPVVLKIHGAQPAARKLPEQFRVNTLNNKIIIETGDRPFGAVTLALADATAARDIVDILVSSGGAACV
ncbi:hypothetical protein ACMT1E_10045 [Sphingomonas flavalba]|uniref:hypothetical protein n=1 Tax=Sphingomonas flavalba TaxID=2559804 RepID=UPI0039E1A1D1